MWDLALGFSFTVQIWSSGRVFFRTLADFPMKVSGELSEQSGAALVGIRVAFSRMFRGLFTM
jgi:hypothetical protein